MKKFGLWSVAAALTAALWLGACTEDDAGTSTTPGQKADPADPKLVDGKADAWNYTNNPARFKIDFEYKLDELPTEGQAEQMPWPDTYWPTYEDSTNARWVPGELSPMEKYDKAFNGWTPPEGFMDLKPFDPDKCGSEDAYDEEYYEEIGPAAKWQTMHKGMYRMVNGVDDDGDGETDECPVWGDDEKRDYDGVETWWGLCHAWVPAAILEPEPKRSVTYNGVTFHVSDIKALLLTLYDRSDALMLGGRCNEREAERDEFGRAKKEECRDTNPGAFHVVVTNMLGRYKRAFAEDRTWNFEVWNQPVAKFETEFDYVTAKEANELMGYDGDEYHFVDRYREQGKEPPVKFAHVLTSLYYITESSPSMEPLLDHIDRYTRRDDYEYILEMDADGNITGGEWVNHQTNSTRYGNHVYPDFLWLPLSVSRSSWGRNPNVDYNKVKMLLEMSLRPEEPEDDDAVVKTYEPEGDDWAPIPIPDKDPAGISSVIEIQDDIEISSLKVNVDITHTYIGDLQVVLEKDGTKVVLHDQTGGGADDLVETFAVHDFDGTSAKGTWRLTVSDHAERDTGQLEAWSLTISTVAEDMGDTKVYRSSDAMDIPDDSEEGVVSTIHVADTGVIEKASVSVKIQHTYIGDLVIELRHGGTKQVLHSREGGGSDDLDKTYTLTGFTSAPLEGDWQLYVSDRAGQDVGKLIEWSLTAAVR